MFPCFTFCRREEGHRVEHVRAELDFNVSLSLTKPHLLLTVPNTGYI